MMDKDYAQIVIEDIKILKGNKAIYAYVRRLINDAYVEEKGFKLNILRVPVYTPINGSRIQDYLNKAIPLDNYIDNCIKIARYTCEHADLDDDDYYDTTGYIICHAWGWEELRIWIETESLSIRQCNID
jgi:hypothetical protein